MRRGAPHNRLKLTMNAGSLKKRLAAGAWRNLPGRGESATDTARAESKASIDAGGEDTDKERGERMDDRGEILTRILIGFGFYFIYSLVVSLLWQPIFPFNLFCG